ncbi:MAG: ABC transporter ATP-binding protein [Chloroflexi bacterium]|nr:MAG: ABC transporter ATP-binding protein [Chloroflexota bacterium]
MLLHCEHVVAGYGSGGDILRGVDLAVKQGDFVCLIGPNGAGKSTLLRTISGLIKPRRGRIVFREEDISGRRPDLLFRDGIAHVPQGRSTFPQMTVWENVLMGAYALRDQLLVRRGLAQAAELFPIVVEQRHKAAGLLSGGEQKQVEIARAMVIQPTLLLLDEPTLGLEPRAARLVVEKMRVLNELGTTILLVEQNARMGLSAAKRGCILELGTIKLEGRGDQLLNDPQVKQLYLGRAAGVDENTPDGAGAREML